MYYHRNIAEQLRIKFSRLKGAGQDTFSTETKYLLDYIEKTSILRGIVQELESLDPEINWQDWVKTHFVDRDFRFPDTETAAAKVCYGIVQDCATGRHAAMRYAFIVTSERNINLSLHEVTRVLFAPFIQYLLDQLSNSSSVIYLLEKYKKRTEWFNRNDLMQRILIDTRQSEAVADSNLREYLFDQGIDYPFSTPSSVSGRADIVANIDKEEPLVVEIKLFDPERGYDRSYIRKGFRQIYDYTADYNQHIGYLVIFNCSEQNLIVKTKSETRMWPPRIQLDNKTFFIVIINLGEPSVSASKRKTLQPYNIDEAFLTSDEMTEDG